MCCYWFVVVVSLLFLLLCRSCCDVCSRKCSRVTTVRHCYSKRLFMCIRTYYLGRDSVWMKESHSGRKRDRGENSDGHREREKEVVAQLKERSLPTPKIRSSNPVIYAVLTVLKRQKWREKRLEMVHWKEDWERRFVDRIKVFITAGKW